MQSKKIFKIKLKLKMYGYSLLGILTLLFILFIAFLNEKLFEISCVCILFFIFRNMYEKQYHSKSLFKCSFLSIFIFTILSIITIPKNISILLIVITTYLVNTISYYVRDYLDIKKPTKKKRNTNRQVIINILNNNLDEEYIEQYCISKGMPKLSETIYLFLNNTMEEVAEILEIDMSTITRRINKFIKESRN